MKSLRALHLKQKVKAIYKNIVSILRSKQSREFFAFSLFVVMAVVFWLILSLKDAAILSVKVPVTYTHIPASITVTNNLKQEIDVTVKDDGLVLFGYLFHRFKPIEIDFREFRNNKGESYISASALIPLLKKQFKPSTVIDAITPDNIILYYTSSIGKKVPVIVHLSVTTAPQSIFGGKIIASPDSVTVFAPASLLTKIKAIHTVSYSRNDLADTLNLTVPLKAPDGVKVTPSQVHLMVPIEEITQKTFELPIEVQNIPEHLSLITFPATIKLSCMIGTSYFHQLKATDFSIVIDYNKLNNGGNNKAEVVLKKYPSYATHITYTPENVEYILEENP